MTGRAAEWALSIRQPWAALVLLGIKTVEVRRWATAVRGPVLIHAARLPDERPSAWDMVPESGRPLAALAGGFVGVAELTGCGRYESAASFAADRESHLNPPEWFVPPAVYGFRLSRPRTLPFLPCRGQVRFFKPAGVLAGHFDLPGESA